MPRFLGVWVVCLLVLVEGVAFAQPTTDAVARVRQRQVAEQLELRGDHSGCAAAYLAIYESAPDADDADEVLYNAGVCHEDAGSIGRAIKTYRILVRRFPTSIRSKRALMRLGAASASIADYPTAAAAYEKYAKHFAGEKDAPNALLNALRFRMALGHNKGVVANSEAFIKMYKKRRSSETTAVFWALARHHEERGDYNRAVTIYKHFIKEVGRRGGADRVLIANAKIGELLWKQSCSRPNASAACLKQARSSIARKGTASRCGSNSATTHQAIARNPRLANSAQKYFAIALRLEEKTLRRTEDAARKTRVEYWLAASRFYQNERRYEAFIPRKPPRFASQDDLARWLSETQDRMSKLTDIYQQEPTGHERWDVASIARIGETAQQFSNALLVAEIPKGYRTDEQALNAYCSSVTSEARSLESVAIAAFTKCLQQSGKTEFNRWSQVCEKQLAVLRPSEFPVAREIHSESNTAGVVLAREPLLVSGPLQIPMR